MKAIVCDVCGLVIPADRPAIRDGRMHEPCYPNNKSMIMDIKVEERRGDAYRLPDIHLACLEDYLTVWKVWGKD